MGTVGGGLAFHILLALPGWALLHLLGLLELRPRALAAAAGPAVIAGAAVVFPALIALLAIGIPNSFPTYALLALALTGAFGVAARLGRGSTPYSGEKCAIAWWERGLIAALGLYLAVAAFAFDELPTRVDNASFWAPKAIALHAYDGIPKEVFATDVYVHPDYPILQPLLEATLYRGIGRIDLELVHSELWLVFALGVWMLGWLLASRARPAAWLPALGALALAPGVFTQVSLGYADVTVACFLAAAVLALGLWLERGHRGHLWLGAIMLGAAANTKNEGLTFTVAIVAAALIALLLTRRRAELVAFAKATALTVAMLAPWRLWIALNDVPNDQVTPLSDALDPTFLADRTTALKNGIGAILTQLGDQDRWLWLVPAALALALATLLVRGAARRVGAFYLAAATLMGAILAWVFWTDTSDPTVPLVASVDRTVTGIVFVCAACAAHLVSAFASGEADEPAD